LISILVRRSNLPQQAPVGAGADSASSRASNVVFAGSQWVILIIITLLGTSELLGTYAFSLALVTPIAMFSHLNLRSILAADVIRRHSFGDHLAVRLATTAVGLATWRVQRVSPAERARNSIFRPTRRPGWKPFHAAPRALLAQIACCCQEALPSALNLIDPIERAVAPQSQLEGHGPVLRPLAWYGVNVAG